LIAFQLAPYQASADALEAIYEDWPFDRDMIRPAIAPTIPLHCSDELLVRCRDLAGAYDLPLQKHLAETKAQVLIGLRKYGRTLTAHLDGLGMLGPHFSAAHAIWLDRDDLGRLSDNGASIVHAPVSNMRFGRGWRICDRHWTAASMSALRPTPPIVPTSSICSNRRGWPL
jgi:5-methylthioadenosine/S-adenosylhomocysteine deaminase